MKFKLQSLTGSEGLNLKEYKPEGDFFIEIEAYIQFGEDEENSERYVFAFGTPNGMSNYYSNLLELSSKELGLPKISFVNSTILVEKYNYDQLKTFVNNYIFDDASGKTQLEQSVILSKKFDWEFIEEYDKPYINIFEGIKNGE